MAPFSRRGFLKLGLTTSVLGAVSAPSMSGCAPRYAAMLPPQAKPLCLSEKELAVLAAFCDRVIAPAPGAPTAREARVAERIDKELGFHQRKLREDIRSALWLIEHGGVLHLTFGRFTEKSAAAQDAHLKQLATGRDFERQAFASLRAVSLYLYYNDERTWPGIHYAGPLVTDRSPPAADSRLPILHG